MGLLDQGKWEKGSLLMVPPDAKMLLIQISNLNYSRFGTLFEKLIYYLFGCIGCSLFLCCFL